MWALDEIVKNSNFYDVGVKLADLIVRGARIREFSDEYLPDYQLKNLFPDHESFEPLEDFCRILPHCMFAILKHSRDAKHCEMYDILKVYWLWDRQSPDLEKHIRRAMERNPSQPFFYAMLAEHLPDKLGTCLRVAKKGLKLCDQMIPLHVENTLRYLAAMSAWKLGIEMMTNALRIFKYAGEEQRNRSIGRGISFLTSALKDLEMIIKTSLPDCRYLKEALILYLPLLYLLKGSGALEENKVCVNQTEVRSNS